MHALNDPFVSHCLTQALSPDSIKVLRPHEHFTRCYAFSCTSVTLYKTALYCIGQHRSSNKSPAISSKLNKNAGHKVQTLTNSQRLGMHWRETTEAPTNLFVNCVHSNFISIAFKRHALGVGTSFLPMVHIIAPAASLPPLHDRKTKTCPAQTADAKNRSTTQHCLM